MYAKTELVELYQNKYGFKKLGQNLYTELANSQRLIESISTMSENSKLYEELRKQYTPEELVESFVFPSDLSPEEQQKADQELWEFRKKLLAEMTEEERLLSGLLRIKYQIKAYVNTAEYDGNRSVAKFLHDYRQVTGKKQKELAEDIDIHPTRISRILNGKEKIGKSIAYRLEKHSGNLIPAIYWWRLAQKEVEHEIRTDTAEREREEKKVKNIVYQKAS